MRDEVLDGFDHVIGAARVKDGVGRIIDEAFYPFRGDSTAAPGPRVFRGEPSAGHDELDSRVLLFEFTKLLLEDDILGGAYSVEDGDAGIEIPDQSEDEVEKFKEFLDQINPEDFAG